MRIMLFGAAGQVGSDCLIALKTKAHEVIAVTRNQLDFADECAVVSYVEQCKPNVIINACAYTAVDKAESESDLADQINHKTVAALAKCCHVNGILLLHLSTDYVFDGHADTPYLEDSCVNPLSVYGKTKLQGEKAIEEHATQYIILRTSWVFGENGNNFVKTMLKLAKDRDQLSVVSDQSGRPTYAGHIVNVLLFFVEKYNKDGIIPYGIYHCSSSGETSWYEFAQAVFEQAYIAGVIAKKPQVSPIPSSAYPTPAPRPMYSTLDTSKLESTIGQALPSWREGLSRFMDAIV